LTKGNFGFPYRVQKNSQVNFMNKIVITLFLISFYTFPSVAQSFDEAMDLFTSEQFAEAAEIFSELEDDQAALFAGKSYLALAEFSKANDYFYRAADSPQAAIRYDALYSLSISYFSLKQFDRSLTCLYEVIGSNHPGLRSDSRRLYTQILHYLSTRQRFELLHSIESSSIRQDIVKISRSYLQPEEYRTLVQELLEITTASERNRLREELLDESVMLPIPMQFPAAPTGIVYNIGVILPTFDENDPDFTIPRNLYFGMLLAAEEFNSRNPDKKVNLVFRNSAEHPDTTEAALNDLVQNKQIDAVIGPLFSEPAKRMATLSDEYQIPMIAPLANSEELNRNFNYIYQLNPAITTHGTQMARFAVEERGLTNLAVIIDQGSPYRAVALAFQREAERLGARVTHFIEENFSVVGYDFTEAASVFDYQDTSDELTSITPVQGVYAPFTGQAGTTMMNLFLNALESMRRDLVIMGTEEWEQHSLTGFQQQFFEIYYTQPFFNNPDAADAEFFEQEYETRFGSSPDPFSRVGFDTATYLFTNLEKAGNPEYLPLALQAGTVYEGLAYRIFLNGERINQHLFVRPLSDKARQTLQERRSPTEKNDDNGMEEDIEIPR
jgi:ABC-type branched-subunit amino acid transport system substrate-binding protein